jgi:hypothetical protein
VRFDARQCNRPHDDHHDAIEAAAIGTGLLTFLMIGLRVVARFWTVGGLWWDDWLHIGAGVCRRFD